MAAVDILTVAELRCIAQFPDDYTELLSKLFDRELTKEYVKKERNRQAKTWYMYCVASPDSLRRSSSDLSCGESFEYWKMLETAYRVASWWST